MQTQKSLLLSIVFIALFVVAAVAYAAATANISFLDSTDQPQYGVTGTELVDDVEGCDVVSMMMTDATGSITDIDTFCLSVGLGEGSDWTDWWSYEGATGLPPLGPITYSLFDTTYEDECDLDENSVECAEYLLSGEVTCLDEDFYQPEGLPAGTPFPVCSQPVEEDPDTCELEIPAGSVVGDAPFATQVYYEPGNLSPGVVLNPGTYVVVGQDESESYYMVVLACEFLWVPKESMQPSYQAPQNGAPLPTRIVGDE